MKIVFINKYESTGGAAIAALRLADGLEEYYKTKNHFVVGVKSSNTTNVYESVPKGLLQIIERGCSFLMSMAGLQYVFIPFSTKTIFRTIQQLKPDIISIHNIHGAYFQTNLLQKLSSIAPIVWTLHDMWAFTANAAYTYGNDAWKYMESFSGERALFPPIGLPTGKWLLRRKQKIYQKSRITFVTPSAWLYGCAAQSPALGGKKILHINNGIDTAQYSPLEKKELRQTFNIPTSDPVVLFSAEKILSAGRKGGSLFLHILEELNNTTKRKIHIVLVGKGRMSDFSRFQNFVVHPTGYIHDEQMMIRLINLADVLLFPSKADNLPNVLLEVIACGVPAVTFDIGGCKEIIRDGENGYVVKAFDTKTFAEKTLYLLEHPDVLQSFSKEGREIAEKEFSLRHMARQYYNLFQEIVPQP